MALFYSDAIRDAQLDAVESTISTAPIMRIYSGSVPASEGASLGAATLLAEGTLPSDWMGSASGGAKAKAGTWTLTGQTGASTGTAGTFFRIYASDGTTPHIQGTVGASGSGADIELDNNSIADAQSLTIGTFTLNAGN